MERAFFPRFILSFSLFIRLFKAVINPFWSPGSTLIPEFSTTFPNSYFYLIEPLKQFHYKNQKFLKNHRGKLIKAEAGNSIGKTKINVHDDYLEGSSILNEEMGEKADGHQELIEILTLDSLFINTKLKAPVLLKVDVQGTEIEVLKGFKKNIKLVVVIVLEASTFKFMKGSPEIYEFVNFMKKKRFCSL